MTPQSQVPVSHCHSTEFFVCYYGVRAVFGMTSGSFERDSQSIKSIQRTIPKLTKKSCFKKLAIYGKFFYTNISAKSNQSEAQMG